MPVRVVIAEDSYLIREGLGLLLAGDDDLELVASVSNLPELAGTCPGSTIRREPRRS